MTINVNPPPRARLPSKFLNDNEVRAWAEQFQTITFQLYNQAETDNQSLIDLGDRIDVVDQALINIEQAIVDIRSNITTIEQAIVDINEQITTINETIAAIRMDRRVVVKTASQLSGTLDATKEYFIDGEIDLTGIQVLVPAGGLSITGYNRSISKLTCSDDNYTMLSGSGNVTIKGVTLEASGVNSKLFNLSGNQLEAVRFEDVIFYNCSELGVVSGYGLYFENETGRTLGAPELTFSGNIGSVKIVNSLVAAISDITALFRAGSSFLLTGRFTSGINADLPTNGALFDFAESNIQNDESLMFEGAYITRVGVSTPTDSSIYPNIDHNSVKSEWVGNTGIPNTHKYLKVTCWSKSETTITAVDSWHVLKGAMEVNNSSHFDMPENGQYRCLTGYAPFVISGNIVIEGKANDEIEIRINKSTDGGVNWTNPQDGITRTISNLSGARDVAYFSVSFLDDLSKNDRIRLEVLNKTGSDNVTMELDSYLIISEV